MTDTIEEDVHERVLSSELTESLFQREECLFQRDESDLSRLKAAKVPSVFDRETIVDEVEEEKGGDVLMQPLLSPAHIARSPPRRLSTAADKRLASAAMNVAHYQKVPVRGSIINTEAGYREDIVPGYDVPMGMAPASTALEQTLSAQPSPLFPYRAYCLPADGESNCNYINVIEDSLEHMPEKLVERDPVSLFDEGKRVQVFD